MVPVVVAAWLIWRDLAPNGQRVVFSDLKHYHPYISSLYPLGRLSEPLVVGDGWKRQVRAEPVYFDVRLPRSMEQAKVRLMYQTSGLEDLRLGLKVGPTGAWRYDLKSFSEISYDGASRWRMGEAVFNLTAAATEDHQLRFMISAPSLKKGGSTLEIKSLEVLLSGKPLVAGDIFRLIKRQIKQYSYVF